MSYSTNFQNIAIQLDTLIQENTHKRIHISAPKQHCISMSISRIGLFRTGGIDVDLISLSKTGALFHNSHHALHKSQNQDMTIVLSLRDKHFMYEAYVVQVNSTNNLYGIKFNQSVDALDEYLLTQCHLCSYFHVKVCPYSHEKVTILEDVWLHLT